MKYKFKKVPLVKNTVGEENQIYEGSACIKIVSSQ